MVLDELNNTECRRLSSVTMESHPLILLAPVKETSHDDLHEPFLGYDDFAETGEQVENTSLYSTPYPSLPPFDRSSTTASACIVGLALSGFATVGSLTGGLYLLCNPTTHIFYPVPLSTAGAEATSLVVNILVALLTDSMGYIHATSLRWALYREGRLKFNTNLRLFNSACKSAQTDGPQTFAGLFPSFYVTLPPHRCLFPATTPLWIRMVQLRIRMSTALLS